MAQQEEINLKKVLPVGLIILAVILLIIFWSRMTVTIEAGHGGVLFRTFGGGIDTENTYDEGFHFIAPWNKMVVYETRQQEIAEELNVLSSNGLEIRVDVSACINPWIVNLDFCTAILEWIICGGLLFHPCALRQEA